MCGGPVHISEMCRQHPQHSSIPTDQRGGLRSSVAGCGSNNAERSEAHVRLDILPERALARTQRSAASRVTLRGDFFEEVQEWLLESVMGGDYQDFAGSIKELNIAFVRPKQFDGTSEYLVQPGMELARLPESRACLIELFQSGRITCSLRFDGLQGCKVIAAPRFTHSERLQGIR